MRQQFLAITLCYLFACQLGNSQANEPESPPILQNVPIVHHAMESRPQAGNVLDLKITAKGEELFWNKRPLQIGWNEISTLRGDKEFTLAIWANPELPFDKIKAALTQAIKKGATAAYFVAKTDKKNQLSSNSPLIFLRLMRLSRTLRLCSSIWILRKRSRSWTKQEKKNF